MTTSRSALLLAVLVFTAPSALARTTVEVASLSVDGQEVRALRCEMDGGLLAVLDLTAVVASLAKQKAVLDACAPEGAAFETRWEWSAGKVVKATIEKSSRPDKDGCVRAAVEATTSSVGGACTAIVLVGETKAAEKAAEVLRPKAPR